MTQHARKLTTLERERDLISVYILEFKPVNVFSISKHDTCNCEKMIFCMISLHYMSSCVTGLSSMSLISANKWHRVKSRQNDMALVIIWQTSTNINAN